MQDFWNFKDFTVVAWHYWPWLLAAAVWGLLLGWASCDGRRQLPPQYRSMHDL